MLESQSTTDNCFDLLPSPLRAYLTSLGIEEPTLIQNMSMQPVLNGKDLLAQSPTGSGKTLAYLLPICMQLSQSKCQEPRALVLVPTRELAQQVAKVAAECCRIMNLYSIAITGGESYFHQKKALKQGVDIVIGTPGRLVDLLEQDLLKLENLKYYVLDEVDEMLDIGFADALDSIRKKMTGISKQTLFFSATISGKTAQIAKNLLTDPLKITNKMHNIEAPKIEHSYIEVQKGSELRALVNTLLFHDPRQALIFCSTKQECSVIADALHQRGFNAAALNGDLTQVNRTATMENFKKGKLRYLVATNVAARGIDVQDMPMVVNYSLPWNLESYTHRVGRTGRAGNEGKALTIVNTATARSYERIMLEGGIKPAELAVPSAKDVISKATTARLAEYKTIGANVGNKTVEKAVQKTLESLSPDEARDILAAMLAQSLKQMDVYYTDSIVLDRKIVNWEKAGANKLHGGGGSSRGGNRRGGGGRGYFRNEESSSSNSGSEKDYSGKKKRFFEDSKPSKRRFFKS